MQADDIGLWQRLIKWHASRCCRTGYRRRNHAHAERAGHACQRSADRALADNHQRFAREFHERLGEKTKVRTGGPVAGFHARRMSRDIGGVVQHQRHHQLRHRFSRVPRHVGHHHAVLFSRDQIDHVGAGRRHADVA